MTEDRYGIPCAEEKPIKVCSCGRGWHEVPPFARYGGDGPLAGFYWECSCGSTFFVAQAEKPEICGLSAP